MKKLREGGLLLEFKDYRVSRSAFGRFHVYAVGAGFKKAWHDRNYKMIIEVARKIPEIVFQEDPKLLMWYDQALTRTGEI